MMPFRVAIPNNVMNPINDAIDSVRKLTLVVDRFIGGRSNSYSELLEAEAED